MSYKKLLLVSAVALGLGAPAAMAKVPADQAARLGERGELERRHFRQDLGLGRRSEDQGHARCQQ